MLEDQVAYLLQRYLGNYVRGLNKEALKISVWRGDVELTNMQLKPEALNALNLPVKVKAGFLGSVKLKVPWSRLGQDPVLVSLDRIFLLAEPATQVEGRTEDAVQEAKKSRVREMELKLLEKAQQLKTELNQSWLGSLVSTIIGNLKLSISNIHIRYEDLESNPGHPFAAGLTLERLSAVTIDDNGRETFITGGALDRIQKFVELDRLALYLDSDVTPWYVNKPWEDLPPSEWVQTFRFGTKNGRPAEFTLKTHTYILQPVTGNANYTKLRPNEFADSSQPLHKSSVNLDDVTLCLSKNGYRDVLKLADNFAAFNQRLKYAHFRPNLSVKSDPRSWWKYAYKAVSDQMKKASGKMSWDQVLKFTSLRKKYISLYASLLKADPSRLVVDDNPEIEDLDHGLDIELILQWRMLAHKFVRQSTELDPDLRKPKTKKSWWSFGRGNQSLKDEGELFLREEDWEQLNKIIGYREGGDSQPIINMEKVDALHTFLEVHMKHNASKLIGEAQNTLAELSCDSFDCSIKLYPEAKVFNLKLGSYQLSSPNGLLAVSATANDSLTGVFSYKPFDVKVDWCMVAKASPCYVTYLKDSVDQIVSFFESNTTVSHAIALETAAAVQMTINEVKRTAQQQVNRALKDHTRFLLDLDIAAPKITIPTGFRPDNANSTKLLIDLGNLVIRTEDASKHGSLQELDMYLQFDLVLSDVSAFLVDGDYHWGHDHLKESAGFVDCTSVSYLPVVDKCGVILKLQLIRLENPSFPSTRIAVRLPSLGFHFSPARYHRLMEVVKIFQVERRKNSGFLRPWDQADFEGLLSLLSRKGVGNREAVWTQRYICLVGPYIYVLESPGSTSYKQYLSLSGKQVLEVPAEDVGDAEHVLAVCDPARSNGKVVEDSSAFILCCDSEDSRKTWKSRLQGAIYRASGSAPITGLSETSSDTESESEVTGNREPINLSAEDLFVTGVLDELKVCFSSTSQHGQSFMKVLLAEEYRLFEFRAIGGRVELSIRSKDMFIGTILKSLEIEDLICRKGTSQSCYLARSFIRNTNECPFSDDVGSQSFENNGIISSEGDDKFYEAPETLLDSMDSQMQSPLKYESVQNSFTSESSLSKPPSFSRIAGLLPCNAHVTNSKEIELTETLDSFVKAQIVMYDQNSARYNNIDKKVTVTLATLSFFCRRPTVIAIMEFANAITVEDERFAYSDDNSSSGIKDQDTSKEEVSNGQHSVTREEATIKGLLGKGKSRVIFSLALNMSRAQIFLMYENETKLASFSQDNLLTDIKVFPSSFSIKASLGNLRISDEGLPSNHMYFWACDMRNPGGSSFIELYFSSFSVEDDDYDGYEYSLFGKLSEVRIVYLNRFIQEVINYFMGLVPKNSRGTVKVKDQVTNSEKWFTTGEIEGSPALKLDLSLRKPIIIMPRRTESKDYLKLDVVHITIRNTFQWVGGSKTDMNAVHLDIMTVMVEDINLNVGTGTELGESIIQDVKGISVSIRRSLRDLLHQIPSIEVAVQIQKLKAALSNREYQIITECAVSNISETPHTVPPFNSQAEPSSSDVVESVASQNPDGFKAESSNREAWITMKVSVAINLVELCLHAGIARDASLATVQASGAWLLYKSNTVGDGFLSATLKGFSVIDDREGTEQEFRLAIGKPQNIGSTPVHSQSYAENTYMTDASITKRNETIQAVPTMLILDARISQFSTFVSLSLQRPQLLVALDFLLAVVEFFVPTVGNILSSEEDKIALQEVDAIIVDQSTYVQPSSEISLSPKRPLVADDQRFDHFIYDGNGGILYLKDRDGFDLSGPSLEAIIYIGSGKKLQFKNVVIKNGQYLDSCIFMGTNSSYSASEEDQVHFDGVDGSPHQNSLRERIDSVSSQSLAAERLTEYIVEFQAIGPELTFYNTSRNVGESPSLSNKLLHAQLDAIVRLVMKGDTTEISADTHGLTMESNGIRILEPFDTSIKYSNSSGKTNIHFSVSDIFMNLSFSILRLFLAVEEDILEFLRMTSTKMTVVCSEFDKVGTIRNHDNDQVYVFWRPSAPPGFAVLGDYLTPLDKPPTKGVLAVNTYLSRVKRPVSFRLIWPPMASGDISQRDVIYSNSQQNGDLDHEDGICSIWFPEAPMGYVALGCVVSNGIEPPPLSSSFCISTSLVSPCSLRDCIMISSTSASLANLAFWRVDNCAGTFLPASQTNFSLMGGAYELRHLIFRFLEAPRKAPKSTAVQASPSRRIHNVQAERSTVLTSGWHFEAVASFQLIWWNRGSKTRKQLSIWRPVVPLRMIYFGDIAVQGFEPPNSSVVLPLTGAEELFKAPMDFHLVGKIKKQRGMDTISFWLPQAPPGFVSLGCIASKGTPKQQDLSSLRCIRSDLVTGDQFMEESLWDTSDTRLTTEPFSVWVVGNELGTFIVRSGFKRPPRRFALKLANPSGPSGWDDVVIDADVRTFSVALFDDYAGLMVPLFNVSLSGIGFSLHGRTDYLNCVVNFSLTARSYNDKYESWEPLVEPVDGFVRYQYDLHSPGTVSQIRLTASRDLNINVSVSNANMIIQAYSSWNNLSHAHEYYKKKDTSSPTFGQRNIMDALHRKNFYIIPQNKLGQDIYIRATEVRGLPNVIWMPSGDMKPVKVPVSKNMLDSHLEGKLCRRPRTMVTVIIADAELPRVEGLASHKYIVTARLVPHQGRSTESQPHQQSARTSGSSSDKSLFPELQLVAWNEMFFFKVDSPDFYTMELIVTDMGTGHPIGFFSAPLSQIAGDAEDRSHVHDFQNKLTWVELSSSANEGSTDKKSSGRIRCTALLSPRSESESSTQPFSGGRKSGFIQISPTREGPWTSVRLNYAAPAACWRLGNDVVASEASVKDGNRYVNIRSLVSVHNSTDFIIDLRLVSRDSKNSSQLLDETSNLEDSQFHGDFVQIDDFFEIEKYNPRIGWVGNLEGGQDISDGASTPQEISGVDLPVGWEWIDDWHLDNSTATSDGWVYAPDIRNLRWPESYNPLNSVDCSARQRRWIRNRKQISGNVKKEISVGILKPGETLPIPLPGLSQSEFYVLHLRPSNLTSCDQYSWSSVVDRSGQEGELGNPKAYSEICVSNLTESEELLYCTQISENSSSGSSKLWFSLSIEALEIAKDIHSDPIQDWNLVIKSPVSVTNFLPLAAEFSVLEKQASGHFVASFRGVFRPGETVKVYDSDIRNPLFFSLLPQRGWLPVQEAVLISHPRGVPSKTFSLRSCITGRVVQIILEQNQDKEQPFLAKIIRVYAPYWFAVARCPPLRFRIVEITGKKHIRKIGVPFKSKNSTETFEEIDEEEIFEGHTIVPALNFKLLGLSVSIAQPENVHFGPVKELSPLGDMDGSLDLYAYDAEGNCMQLFISTKPCPHQSVPTKVISVRPFMTFTNRLGRDLFIKLSSEDDQKILRASDSRVSFAYRQTDGLGKLQVRLEDTSWSFPVHVTKEDTIILVLRRDDGTRTFLRIEIRGFEEGSRFIVVFRIGSANGPMRIENRTVKTISIRQSGFGEDAWIRLQPLSTTNFCWEDPYGQPFLDAKIDGDSSFGVWKLDLESTGLWSTEDGVTGLNCHIEEEGNVKVAKFRDGSTLASRSDEEIRLLAPSGSLGNSQMQGTVQNNAAPIELIIELGVVGVSIIDHRPKELLYLYLERVFVSYSTGYGGGTSRLKLILGHLQIDNQLPLTLMPVLLAPEQVTYIHNPTFKMTITIRNENIDGIQVYPYIYMRVTEKWWRLNIHEPIIWALVNFYNSLQLGRLPQSSSVTQVDPEIRIDLIDVSEVRLKVSLETAPAQRPHGVLGVWSPILSAVGNAFKIQVHLRRVMHRDRFMRKSSIIPAIGNRIFRDLIHNPLHLIFSVDVLGMTSSTLASLSRGFAELSTDGEFLQLRSKQVWSRRITGVGDGIIQGTEAFAQGVAFGVTGMVTKPVESARQNGLLGLAHGLGQAFLGFFVQPVSGALDFFSLTVDGISASCSRCLQLFNNTVIFQRIRNPRAIHAYCIVREYCEREAIGQMILHLAEARTNLGCTEIFKEPSKFALSDYYEEHFIIPNQKVVLVTNRRVMLLQCPILDKIDKKPSKIMWDVPWEKLMALELAKAGYDQPSHLILHLKYFRRSENFVRIIRCSTDEQEGREPQSVRICSVVRKMWKAYQSDVKSLLLKVPSSQRHVYFAWSEDDGRESRAQNKAIINSRELLSVCSTSDETRFVTHVINFTKIWSSELESKGRCTLCKKQVSEDARICTIWRPICPNGYVSIGDIAHLGDHPPNVAAVYRKIDRLFAPPVGYDLVWRNCPEDYITPVSIWYPRAPEGFICLGCVAVDDYVEPDTSLVHCVAESLAEETDFEEQKVWSTPESYPWACHIYQVRSDALHFVAVRQSKEESDWKAMRVLDDPNCHSESSVAE